MIEDVLPGEPEGFSLYGEPLYRQPIGAGTQEKLVELFNQALADYKADPSDPDKTVWLGRRTAYLGRYRDAIAVYSLGLDRHPENPKLYRHRGHRFLTLRMIDRALEDFTKAATLMVLAPDMVEPDGMPNPLGQPVSTLYFNVYYHLALSYYLKGMLEEALEAYRLCMTVSDIDDKYVATAHWTYMTLRLLGRKEEADKLLDRVQPEMDIIENQNYHQCLLMYKGLNDVETLLEEARGQGTLGMVTTGYGIANWYKYNGEPDKAASVLREILSIDTWAGFGYIAAEADLKRMGLRK